MFMPRGLAFIAEMGEIVVTFFRDPKELKIVLGFSLLEADERDMCPVISIGEEIFPSHPKDRDHQVCSGCCDKLKARDSRVADFLVRLVSGIRRGKTTILPDEAHALLVSRAGVILAEGEGGTSVDAAIRTLEDEGLSEYLATAVVLAADRERRVAAFKEALLSSFFHLCKKEFHEVKGDLRKLDIRLGSRLSDGDLCSYWIAVQGELLEKAKRIIAEKIESLTVADVRYSSDEEIVRAAVGGWSGILKVIFREDAKSKLADLRLKVAEERRQEKERRRLVRLGEIEARGKSPVRFFSGTTAELPVLISEEEIPLLLQNGGMAVLHLDGPGTEAKVIRVKKTIGGRFSFLEIAGATVLSADKTTKASRRKTEERDNPGVVWVVLRGKTVKALVIPDPSKVDMSNSFGQYFVGVFPNGGEEQIFQIGIGGFSPAGPCQKATPEERRNAKAAEAVPA